MLATVKHSSIQGILSAPASKSYMQRAVILALLRKGVTIIRNPSFSNDDRAVLRIAEILGAKVESFDGGIRITGHPSFNFSGQLNCGESGLAVRMLIPVVATSGGTVTFNGEGSLLRRPVRFFDNVFPILNVEYRSADGFLPVTLKGPLQPRDIKVDGTQSSQFISGLLTAYCHVAEPGTVIRVSGAVSKPYLDITVEMLYEFGYRITRTSEGEFVIGERLEIADPLEIRIPGDWSNAAFLIVAGAIAGQITVTGLDAKSKQGDRAIIDVIKAAGCNVVVGKSEIRLDNRNRLTAFSYDANDTPDLFPPLASLAIFCEGTSEIKGVGRLRLKESDRAKALVQVFTAMGADIWIEGEVMKVRGGKSLRNAMVDGHNDHRIVMAAAVAALASQAEITIRNADAVAKSYPSFFNDLESVGAHVYLT